MIKDLLQAGDWMCSLDAVCQLSQLLGKIPAATPAAAPAVLSAPIWLTSTATENTVLEALQIVQADCLPEQGVNERTSPVVRRSSGMEWQRHLIVQPPLDLVIETDASLIGWRTVCKGVQRRGSVVSGRTAGTYQCTGRHVYCSGFCKGQGESPCSPQDGQYIYSHLCDQDGTRSITLTAVACQIWDWYCTFRGR